MTELSILKDLTTQIRRDIVRMVHGVPSGHPDGSLGCTAFLTVLYKDCLRHDQENWNVDVVGQELFLLKN